MVIIHTYSICIYRFYSQAFSDTNIKSINIPKSLTALRSNVFYDTPCSNSSIFQPGNTVVNLELVSAVPSVSRRNFDRVLSSLLATLFCHSVNLRRVGINDLDSVYPFPRRICPRRVCPCSTCSFLYCEATCQQVW